EFFSENIRLPHIVSTIKVPRINLILITILPQKMQQLILYPVIFIFILGLKKLAGQSGKLLPLAT
ncbi:MAG: hypothetical protein MI799_06785, partial [Desulfobacterales bacterium]|nr:hypothetical protein [Desulfobacterales bacterium]